MLKAEIVTEPIPLSFSAGVPVTVRHGLGRQIGGFIVVWRDAPGDVWVQAAGTDTSKELVLVASAAMNVRIVLL